VATNAPEVTTLWNYGNGLIYLHGNSYVTVKTDVPAT